MESQETQELKGQEEDQEKIIPNLLYPIIRWEIQLHQAIHLLI